MPHFFSLELFKKQEGLSCFRMQLSFVCLSPFFPAMWFLTRGLFTGNTQKGKRKLDYTKKVSNAKVS